MTELEALNVILSTIGEAPVDGLPDLTVNQIEDSSLALTTLREVSRAVQSEGWSWNTQRQVALVNNAGTITVPSTTLRWVFDPDVDYEQRYTIRGNRVYDRFEQSFDLGTTELTLAELVTQLDWDDMPFSAQEYIKIRAARIHSDRAVNSAVIYTFTAADEQTARSMLTRDELAHQHSNMLHGSRRTNSRRGDAFVPIRGNMHRRIH